MSWGPQSPTMENKPLLLQYAFSFWCKSCCFWVHYQDLITVCNVLSMWKLSGLAFKLYFGNKLSLGGKMDPMISCISWSSESPIPLWLPPWGQRCLLLNVPLPHSCLFPCGLSLSCLFSFHYFLHNKCLPPLSALSLLRGPEALAGSWGKRHQAEKEQTKLGGFLHASGLCSL